MSKMIEVNQISKSFKNQQVLRDVSLSCEKGKIYGIIGYNGSGKSVLFKCICGYYRTDEGEILVRGQKIGADTDMIRDAGIIIEEPAFLKQYSGIKNLDFLYRLNHKPDREYLRQAMIQVGLDQEGMEQMRKLFLSFKEEGRTLLFASHNRYDIESLCDEVYEMNRGELKQIM